ncbi:hypothetical protein EDB89DRAFT_1902628 [Lactarius sanguifluus]|nr:hypothetical protein EDB89DRAFT_1902628 [Lactarius sanguifluus]
MSSPQNSQCLSLANRISSPQLPSLSLEDRISSPNPSTNHKDIPILHLEDFPDFNAPSPGSEPILVDLPGGIYLPGYEHFDPYNATHFAYHGANEPLGDFTEDLVATPCWDPMPNTVDDHHLTLFAPNHPDAQAVDIANGGLCDLGIVADIDHYRVLWSEKEELQCQERELADAWDQWHDTLSSVERHLTRAKAHSRLHPYLMGQAYIPTVCNNNDCAISSGIVLSGTLVGSVRYKDISRTICYVPHSHKNHGGTGACPWHKEVWATSSSWEWTTSKWAASYDEDH